MTAQIDALLGQMESQELDALLITNGQNRRYLSGFGGSAGTLLVTRGAQVLITDFRYWEQAEQQAPDWRLHRLKGRLDEALPELLGEIAPGRVGFEADDMTVATWDKLREAAPEGIEWVPTTDLVRGIRMHKSDRELAAIRKAQRIADQAAAELPHMIEPGRTEREVAWALERRLRELGADGLAFDIAMASGPNSAQPHHKSGDRVIGENEMVLVDFGALVDGYHSDMTRTFFTGEPTEEYAKIYNIVLEALERAEAALAPGLGLRASDALARDFIAEQGYGEQFGHSLGHGVGLQIHELPNLSFRAEEEAVLAEGQIVTVEPGIYLPGWGGVRIEDLVYVTADGIENLTTTTKDIDAWRKARG